MLLSSGRSTKFGHLRNEIAFIIETIFPGKDGQFESIWEQQPAVLRLDAAKTGKRIHRWVDLTVFWLVVSVHDKNLRELGTSFLQATSDGEVGHTWNHKPVWISQGSSKRTNISRITSLGEIPSGPCTHTDPYMHPAPRKEDIVNRFKHWGMDLKALNNVECSELWSHRSVLLPGPFHPSYHHYPPSQLRLILFRRDNGRTLRVHEFPRLSPYFTQNVTNISTPSFYMWRS